MYVPVSKMKKKKIKKYVRGRGGKREEAGRRGKWKGSWEKQEDREGRRGRKEEMRGERRKGTEEEGRSVAQHSSAIFKFLV